MFVSGDQTKARGEASPRRFSEREHPAGKFGDGPAFHAGGGGRLPIVPSAGYQIIEPNRSLSFRIGSRGLGMRRFDYDHLETSIPIKDIESMGNFARPALSPARAGQPGWQNPPPDACCKGSRVPLSLVCHCRGPNHI